MIADRYFDRVKGRVMRVRNHEFRSRLIRLWEETRCPQTVRGAYVEYRKGAASDDAFSAALLYASFVALHGEPEEQLSCWCELQDILRRDLTYRQRIETCTEALRLAFGMGDVERAAEMRSILAAQPFDSMAAGTFDLMGFCNLTLGSIARMERDYERARSHYLVAGMYLTLSADGGPDRHTAAAWLRSAEEYARMGDFGLAAEYLHMGTEQMPAGRGRHDIGCATGYVLCARGAHEIAIPILATAAAVAREASDYQMEVWASVLHIRALVQTNDLDAATRLYRTVRQLAAMRRHSHLLDEVRADVHALSTKGRL